MGNMDLVVFATGRWCIGPRHRAYVILLIFMYNYNGRPCYRCIFLTPLPTTACQSYSHSGVLGVGKQRIMDPVTKNEWVMVGTVLVTVILWISGQALDIASAFAAMMGLSILLLLGVLDWDDCLSEKSAWDTFAWFGVLVGMAAQLTTLGIMSWLSDGVAKSLKSLSFGCPAAFFILQTAYFFVHYLFAIKENQMHS